MLNWLRSPKARPVLCWANGVLCVLNLAFAFFAPPDVGARGALESLIVGTASGVICLLLWPNKEKPE